MPGEEMEITTDFGHPGFGEDIDIDLDFAVGQVDEDLELADFDQVQEMQNFNTDTRDELMAEGDDASYGMIDAGDIDHNEAATTANDIEIDLGDPDENIWQQDVPQDGSFETAAEIDYVDNTNVSSTDVGNVGQGEASWLETPAYSTSQPHEVEQPQVDANEIAITESLLQDGTALIDGVNTQDFGLSKNKEDDTKTLGNSHDDENKSEVQASNVVDEQQDDALDIGIQVPADQTVTDDQSAQGHSNEELDRGVSRSHSIHETYDDVQDQASNNEVPEVGYIQGDSVEQEEQSASVVSPHQSEFDGEDDEQANQRRSPNFGGSEHQLGGDSYTQPTNDQDPVDQAPGEDGSQAPNADEVNGQSVGYDSDDEGHEAASVGEDGEASHAVVPHVEHPLSIATRHEMFISYGQTDYRLFAKSKDDDPNQYFLRDMFALELPLSKFLASLREVIADEVSVLDELVMHVDGLGLEFSESSSSDMLEDFTFGDILSLYDKLVKNDNAEQAPDLYTYLMVRPHCHKRLVALLDSANAGRGLSEIAVYREATPVHDDDQDQLGGYDDQGSYVQPDGEEGEEQDHTSYSPLRNDEDEELCEEGDHVEDENGEQHGNAEEFADNEPNSPSAHASVVGGNNEGSTEQIENAEENHEEDHEENPEENTEKDSGADADGTTADGLIDYSDDELDLSSLKQGNTQPSFNTSFPLHCRQTSDCQCNACFEIDLERLDASWRLDTSKPIYTSIGCQTYSAPQQNKGQRNASLPTPSPTEKSFHILEIRPTKDLRTLTNSNRFEDQHTNASPNDHAQETRKESDVTNKTDDGDVANSEATSATVTLNGDDNDEIDYSDDDGEEYTSANGNPSNDGPSTNGSSATATLQVPVDDEITWESENEDARNEPTTTSKTASNTVAKGTVQVSPSSGKRPRSDTDFFEDEIEHNDVKRRRPS
ncbi:uncharacterized protein F4822DRAFT_433070 [Hypoxylon trugodes]|uniref:uncharacterized protein n=1 Tax=Hypoxylon trugodes TaxID=326681 RepID=UPI00219385DD|nr:uncharacterized protein F4822DRAFT_433070 [Hypoxylon trugodes]KAI1384526.1 hypothetical protein F4822DRAFT_433070 [Hypoxylon trugodes]